MKKSKVGSYSCDNPKMKGYADGGYVSWSRKRRPPSEAEEKQAEVLAQANKYRIAKSKTAGKRRATLQSGMSRAGISAPTIKGQM